MRTLSMRIRQAHGADNGLAEAGFCGYVDDSDRQSPSPGAVIDKIAPRPDPDRRSNSWPRISIGGLDAWLLTSKNTYVAPFVNAEECQYLVIEDAFPNGRPALDKGGIIFTDRATVDEGGEGCEGLHLPGIHLHTALAIYGCLLGLSP